MLYRFALRLTTMNQGKLFDHLNKRGIYIFTWVQNTEEEWDEAQKLGGHIDGVVTDVPTVLKAYGESQTVATLTCTGDGPASPFELSGLPFNEKKEKLIIYIEDA